ncbi:hypothetical protein F4678DRAFT_465820 [Xylaria arbuscula]|nr:hypothetical protein F4678DRAFT_465820 [Xylaria arbuscula]
MSKPYTKPAPEEIAALQRKYSGLDDDLYYVEGHTVARKYDAYKAADAAAAQASIIYRSTAAPLRQEKPYAPGVRPTGPVQGSMYYPDGHRILAPLAGNIATAADYHADRRDSFNNGYEDLLQAKGVHETHVGQALQARKMGNTWRKNEAKHVKYSGSGLR